MYVAGSNDVCISAFGVQIKSLQPLMLRIEQHASLLQDTQLLLHASKHKHHSEYTWSGKLYVAQRQYEGPVKRARSSKQHMACRRG